MESFSVSHLKTTLGLSALSECSAKPLEGGFSNPIQKTRNE